MKGDELRIHPLADQQLQMMKQPLQAPHLLCPSGNIVTNVCVNSECPAKNAFFCDQQQCHECLSSHSDCELVRLKQLTTLVQNRTEKSREVILAMLQKQNQVIEKIIQMRKMLVQKYQWASLPHNIQQILDELFRRREKRVQLSSSLAFEMFRTLKKGKEEEEERGKRVIQQFEREIDQIRLQLVEMKETLLEGMYADQSRLNSKIVKENTSEELLFNSLNSPKRLSLLFRASEHDFSAVKFHQYCDGIPHTLTLVRTQYGKTIAGYTPLHWQSPLAQKFPYGRTVPDPSRRTFLFSMELKEKLVLREPDSAIFLHRDWGPYFGRGADLRIGSRCNVDSNSYTSVPVSYEFQGRKTRCDQQTWTAFCGAPRGSFFRVEEYQVFRVQW